MFFHTIYYIQDKTAAFYNISNWLKPDGFMVIHIVNREKYDPIVKASDPLYKINAQMYSKERLNRSYVKFNDFQYKSELIPKQEDSRFIETMKDDNSERVIRNEHRLYMEKQIEIIEKAKKVGFILKGKIGLDQCGYKYQYLYVFKKEKKL